MKLPARFIAGNLVWTQDGSVWAVYRLEPASFPWLPVHEKMRLHQQTRAALMALAGESMVLSLCAGLPGGELSSRMQSGSDGPDAWRSLVALSERMAADVGPTERLVFLAARLASGSPRPSLRPLVGSAAAAVSGAFGLPSQAVPAAEVHRRAHEAEALLARFPAGLTVRAAGAAEVCWIYSRAVERGIGQPVAVPVTLRPDAVVTGPRLTAVADAVFKEGGFPGDPGRPAHCRYLRVETEAGIGYQAFLAISDMPHRYEFPDGAEWLPAADQAGFPVDWCLRIRPIPNGVAQASARRQARQLQSQVGEYDGDPAGAPPGLAEAMEALQDLRAQLAANPSDCELEVTMILNVASNSLGELEERVASLRCLYAAMNYDLHRPIGGQLGLLEAMLPGSPLRSPARDYVHHLLGRDLAAGMPFAGAGVGDPGGMLLGYCLDAATFRPVLFDPAYGPRINRSGSAGVFGALGSGKSYLIKSLVHAALARGGRVVALDRTISGEYVRLAGVTPGAAEVIRLTAGSPVCLDPLRLFSGEDRVSVAIGFLTLVTGASPTDPQGIALAEAVQTVAARPSGCMADVVRALEEAAGSDPGAEAMRRSLRSIRHAPLAHIAFGDGPVASLDADYLVLHAPGLSLPDRDVVLRDHLARRLLPEQVLSQALLYLVAAVARHVMFSDPRRFAAALFDEAWALTASLQGRSLLLDAIRDGRKHNAAVWLASQHPGDLGDELTHLLGPRFVFRQAGAAAPAALRFVGVEPSERAVDLLVGAPEGTCLFRDVRDRVGSVQVLPAMTGELHEAFDTNPLAAGRPASQTRPA